LLATLTVFAGSEFRPGEIWNDLAGHSIQAHGGGILVYKQLFHKTVYYWYGEDRTPGIRAAVSCYSSKNLYDWKREGVALWQTNLPRYYGVPTFIERPKVIFNPRTKKFVMWMHVEQNGYRYACAGVAVSDKPAEPFTFLNTFRPITNDFDFPTNDTSGQKEFGATFRDMNLFVDDDGKAYVFYAGEDNWTMYVVRLNKDFTGPEKPAIENKTWARILVRWHREAPAPFKYRGKYYLITSACTGWAPNAADVAEATNILGPYQSRGNPCVGEGANVTYGTQSTYVLSAPRQKGKFIFMADEWHPQNLSDSRLIWLPFTMNTNATFTLPWRDRWDLSVFK
jgi:hypothetical protein